MERLKDAWFLGMLVACISETIVFAMVIWMRLTGRLVVKK